MANDVYINWCTRFADIDQLLYSKYSLSIDEIDFIEKMIKPME